MNVPFQAGQLGDGRAILLGEYANSKGEHWELQLKGMESFLKVILTNNILSTSSVSPKLWQEIAPMHPVFFIFY